MWKKLFQLNQLGGIRENTPLSLLVAIHVAKGCIFCHIAESLFCRFLTKMMTLLASIITSGRGYQLPTCIYKQIIVIVSCMCYLDILENALYLFQLE